MRGDQNGWCDEEFECADCRRYSCIRVVERMGWKDLMVFMQELL